MRPTSALGSPGVSGGAGEPPNLDPDVVHIRVFSGQTWAGAHKFIGFVAIDCPKPYKFIGFGAIDCPKPYKFIGFVAIDCPNPINL